MRVHGFSTGTVAVKSAFMAGSVAAGGDLAFLRALRRDPNLLPPMPVLVWVIETDSELILVDTGDHAPSRSGGLMQTTVAIEPEQEMPAQLKRLGFSLADVSRVVLTHLHSDHVGGLGAVMHRPALVSRPEWQAVSGFPGRLMRGVKAPVPSGFRPTLIDFAPEPWGAFDNSLALAPDGNVRLVPSPGHSSGHQSVVVSLPELDVFLAGDVTYDQAALGRQAFQGHIDRPDLHADTLRRVLAHMSQRQTVYLPSHDPESLARLAALQAYPLAA